MIREIGLVICVYGYLNLICFGKITRCLDIVFLLACLHCQRLAAMLVEDAIKTISEDFYNFCGLNVTNNLI